MITKRNDYNYLLDKLRFVSENYCLDIDGNVIDKKGNKVNDEQIAIYTRFYIAYYNAYKNVAEEIDGYPIANIDEGLIVRALSDYDVFNSFINNCVNEYRMYNGIGTGNILYFPYEKMAETFFQNWNTRMILNSYLNDELSEAIHYNQEIQRVKK